MRPGDAEAVFAYSSDPRVTRHSGWGTHRSVEDSRSFLRFMVERYENGEPGNWGIVHKASGELVGNCGFAFGWSPEHARAELGYTLSRAYWGRGLMPEAVRRVIRFGFERLNLNRIEARCFAENSASERVMQKAGMLYEGTLREQLFIRGSYRDMKMYAILRSEYLSDRRR